MMSAAVWVAAFSLRLTMMRDTSANSGWACDARAFGSSSRLKRSCGHVVGMLSRKSATAAKRVSPVRLSSSDPVCPAARNADPPYCLTGECYRRQPGAIADGAVGVAQVLAGRREGVARPQGRQHLLWAFLPRPLRLWSRGFL